MRALVQRVTRGAVTVGDATVGEIDRGLVVLVGVTHTDDAATAHALARKVAHLRVFEDADGKFNLSLLEVGGAALVVSQFTLYADASRGRRPDFLAAARPEVAEPLVAEFCRALKALGLRVEQGQFRAKMRVEIWNDGPVTIWLDTAELAKKD